jgi:hypothetical protein
VMTCSISNSELMAAGMESLSIFWCLVGKCLNKGALLYSNKLRNMEVKEHDDH